MIFDKFGNLILAEMIMTDLKSAEAIFVADFSTSTTRFELWKNYLEFISELQAIVGTGFSQWINGSFTTKKQNPRDIDLLIFLDWNIYESHEKKLRDWRKALWEKGLDCYYLKVYPESHKLYPLYEMDRAFWNFQFGYNTRTSRNKGYLQLNF